MVLEPDLRHEPLQRGMPALLRAVGELLIAMAGADLPSYEEPPPPPRWAPARRRAAPPPAYAPAPPPAPDGATNDEVELILADTRARAHKLIEESVVRAQELLREQRSGDHRTIDRVRSSVRDLGAEMRSLHERLDGIEALLQRGTAPAPQPAPAAAAAAPTQAAPTPAAVEPVEVEPAPREQLEPAPPPPPEAREPEPARPVAPPPIAAPSNGAASVEAAVFAPEDGTIVLQVAPVAGFQGLMRVQDAVVRVAGVGEAGVEAYAQGEAKLRLRLSEPVDPRRLAAALGEQLGVEVRVAAASQRDRVLQLAFE